MEKSERQTQVQDLRCQSGPSAKSSVIFCEGDSFKNYGADQQRLQISDLHFDKFPSPASAEAILASSTKSVIRIPLTDNEDFRSSTESTISTSLIQCIASVGNCEQLHTSVLNQANVNRIIPNSHFNRKISLKEQKAQKQDRFLRGRQIAYLIYEYFRVIGANDSVENYADLFTVGLRNDDIQEFDSKWDGILLSMTKIPCDEILESLYKLRIRESEKLKTVLELYDLEIHQKKVGPDYHRLKTWVKRSIEQDIRNKNFWGQKRKL